MPKIAYKPLPSAWGAQDGGTESGMFRNLIDRWINPPPPLGGAGNAPASTPESRRWRIVFKPLVGAVVTFENNCLAQRHDFWRPLPRLWCGSTPCRVAHSKSEVPSHACPPCGGSGGGSRMPARFLQGVRRLSKSGGAHRENSALPT